MIFRVLSGPPGCGKTTLLRSTALDLVGRHLLAAPRTALLDEHAAELRALAEKRSLDVSIVTVHSRQGEIGRIDRRVRDALASYGSDDHAVVLITHEMLLSLDPALIQGWHVSIDELPETAVVSGQFSAATTWSALARQYALAPSEKVGWWEVVPSDEVEALTRRQIMTSHPKLACFHTVAQCPTRQVYVDVANWDATQHPKRSVRWWSAWTPMSLAGCASITITGASFASSLLWHACRRLHGDEMKCEFVEVRAGQARAQPIIKIYFYARHAGSTEWWLTDDGSRCLVQISRHLEQIGFSGYWSTNKTAQPYFRHRFGGQAVEPKQAGTNSLRHHTSCCLIYSSKAQTDDEPILEVLGLNREAIKRTREDEDILQFSLRGAVRIPHFAGTYDVHLYDEAQAMALRDKLLVTGITDQVELIAIEEAGLMDVTRTSASSPPTTVSANARMPREQAEKKAVERQRGRRRRAEAKAKRQAEGTYRGVGRPRTGASRSPEPPESPYSP